MSNSKGYNQRLFKHRIGRKIHLARFHWLKNSIAKLNINANRIIELGCFDGKVLDYIDKPQFYAGYDANWEGGLEKGKEKWKDYPQFKFEECTEPHQIKDVDDKFDVCISQETLEHIPPELIDPYLKKLGQNTSGYLFVTVPNEKGLIFAMKYLGKRMFGKSGKKYTFGEFMNALFGRMDKVPRWQHKGFDYDKLISEISEHFEIVSVEGLPFKAMPASLNFTVAIIGKSKYN
ncbi:MAG: methyltransferase domain-containing protein [Bacteroidota bacterium]